VKGGTKGGVPFIIEGKKLRVLLEKDGLGGRKNGEKNYTGLSGNKLGGEGRGGRKDRLD